MCLGLPLQLLLLSLCAHHVACAVLECASNFGVLISGRNKTSSYWKINGFYTPLPNEQHIAGRPSYFNELGNFYLYFHSPSTWHIQQNLGNHAATAFVRENDSGKLDWHVWQDMRHVLDTGLISKCHPVEFPPGTFDNEESLLPPSQNFIPPPLPRNKRRTLLMKSSHLTHTQHIDNMRAPPPQKQHHANSRAPEFINWKPLSKIKPGTNEIIKPFLSPTLPPAEFKENFVSRPPQYNTWKNKRQSNSVDIDHKNFGFPPTIIGPLLTPRTSTENAIPGYAMFAPMKAPQFHPNVQKAPVRHRTLDDKEEYEDMCINLDVLNPLLIHNDHKAIINRTNSSLDDNEPTPIKLVPASWILCFWGAIIFLVWTMERR